MFSWSICASYNSSPPAVSDNLSPTYIQKIQMQFSHQEVIKLWITADVLAANQQQVCCSARRQLQIKNTNRPRRRFSAGSRAAWWGGDRCGWGWGRAVGSKAGAEGGWGQGANTHTQQGKHTNTSQVVTIDHRDREAHVIVSEFLNVHRWVLFRRCIFD